MVWLLTWFIIAQSTLISYHTEAFVKTEVGCTVLCWKSLFIHIAELYCYRNVLLSKTWKVTILQRIPAFLLIWNYIFSGMKKCSIFTMVFVAKSLKEIFMHLVFEELTHKYNPIPNTFMHQNLVTVFPQHFSIYICFSHVNVKRNITMCTTTHRGAKNKLIHNRNMLY